MAIEYVRVTKPEQIYSQKNLLLAQLNLLTALKHHHNYKELRKQELILKITLKKHADDAQQQLNLLEALLPKVSKKDFLSPKEEHKEADKKLSLVQEIETIKEKIRRLS